MAQIKITMFPDGSMKSETEGYSGPSCLEATKKLYASLGASKIEEKDEMFNEEQNLLSVES